MKQMVICEEIKKAALSGNFSSLPPRLLNKEEFSKTDEDGNNALHLACQHNQLKNFPQKLLIESLVCWQNKKGQTPLHIAAAEGNIKDIPQRLLTKTNLLIKNNKEEETAVHIWAKKGDPSGLTPKLLSPQLVLQPNLGGLTAFHHTFYRDDWDSAEVSNLRKILLESLTEKQLLELFYEEKQEGGDKTIMDTLKEFIVKKREKESIKTTLTKLKNEEEMLTI
jgi:hypothetical protein